MRRGTTSALMVAVAAAVVAVATLDAKARWFPVPVDEQRELYVADGRLLAHATLGFDAVAADVYWIRAVQHYGRDRRSLTYAGRYALLHPLIDVVTTLDPYFSIAYQFGAVFLAEPLPNGPGRLDLGLALLEKGLAVEPNRWQYAQYLGFLHYWHGTDRAAAARAFERAARIPDAPNWLQPLAVGMLVEGGERDAAVTMLREMTRSEDRWIRELAERKLAEIGAR